MLISRYSFRALSLALCLGLLTSCAKREDTDVTTETDTTVTVNGSDTRMPDTTHMGGNTTHGGMNMASMTDGNILAWMGMADSMEVAMATMARTKAQHTDIRKFAQMMATEHAKMKKEGEVLAQRQSIAAVAPTLQMNTYDMMTQLSDLQNASGHTFDSLYIESQVAMHQHVLDNLSKVNPQNAELRAAIEKVKPHIQHHLEEARRIQVKIQAKP